MKKLNKHGFTIVELVIVIAVIAILAAVLIPTFGNVIENARQSSDTQVVRQLNNAIAIESAYNQGKKPATMHDAVQLTRDYGYDVGKIVAKSSLSIAFDCKNSRFVLLNEAENKYVFPINETSNESNQILDNEKINYFVVRESVPANGKYSIYAGPNWTGSKKIEIAVGFDAGDETFESITYVRSDATEGQDVVIRTNSYDTVLTIKAENDTVKHFDKANKVEVKAVAMHSYHEFGDVLGNISLEKGNVVVEEGCKASAVVIDMTAAELATVTTLSADNSKAPEVPIILNTTETLWGVNPHNELIDPEKNNIIYANFGGGTLPANFDTLSKEEKETAIGTASASVEDYGALVDSVGYDTFETAISNVTKAGQTVRLLKDYKYETSPSYVYTQKANYTIDLNGHTLDMNDSGFGLYVLKGQTVTLNDSEGTGSLKNRQCVVYMKDGANLIINGGHIGGVDKDQATIYGYGNLTINGGYVDGAYKNSQRYYGVMVGNYTNDNTPASFILNGGEVNGGIYINGQDKEKNILEITGGRLNGSCYIAGNCIANISGGTISGASAIYAKGGTWTITGGTFIATETEHVNFVHGDSSAAMTGGAFVFESCDYPSGSPVLNITGGEFIVNSEGSYGIEIYNYQGSITEIKALKDFKGTTHTFEVE